MKNFKNYTLEIGNVKFFQAACKVVRLSTEEVNTLANLIDKKSMVDLKFYLDSLYLGSRKKLWISLCTFRSYVET